MGPPWNKSEPPIPDVIRTGNVRHGRTNVCHAPTPSAITSQTIRKLSNQTQYSYSVQKTRTAHVTEIVIRNGFTSQSVGALLVSDIKADPDPGNAIQILNKEGGLKRGKTEVEK